MLTIGSGNLTLGANSGVDLDVDGNSASLSNSIDVANGSAVLGGATLSLYQNEQTPYTSCNTLTPGATVTLLSASGGITGSLVVGGQTITRGGSATEPITNECGGSHGDGDHQLQRELDHRNDRRSPGGGGRPGSTDQPA